MRRTPMFAMALVLALALAAPVAAGNPFARSTTTADGYHTWDSDMVNIEGLSETGTGVYVAVLDTGLAVNWSDYFPRERVRADLGIGFYQPVNFKTDKNDPCGLEGTVGTLRTTGFFSARGETHGTHVASTIIGYSYYSNHDAAQGFPLPPIQVRGIAPNATIIPVKVLGDYQQPALPKCPEGPIPAQPINFGTAEMIAAGLNYVTDLAEGGLRPMVVNMSLGGDELEDIEKAALDRAIEAGVIVVAAAGNDGDEGMHYPGAYSPVISVGAAGWTGEWLDDGASGNPPANEYRYRMWWLKDKADGSLTPPLKANSGDVADPTSVDHVYVTDFSSRELEEDHDLDVLAPGSWVRGPYPGVPGNNRMPWFARGISDLVNAPTSNFFYVGGTSMATPHVAGLAAMMLEKNPGLSAAQIEQILESTALPIPAGTRDVWDPFYLELDEEGNVVDDTPQFVEFSWDDDATGSGLVQADAALSATP